MSQSIVSQGSQKLNARREAALSSSSNGDTSSSTGVGDRLYSNAMKTLEKRNKAIEEAKKRNEEAGANELQSKPKISDKASKLKPTRAVFQRLSEDAAEKEKRLKEAVERKKAKEPQYSFAPTLDKKSVDLVGPRNVDIHNVLYQV